MSRFLEQVKISRYGALADLDVGPFGPGLNVVYGPNEAGKSTIASFVGGVLFGWEEARGVRNTYRSPEGERAGSLVFADETSDSNYVVFRGRNEDGLIGDAGIAADIDHATYRTMFSLSSDELRSLRNTSDVTARLLTAGSGTGSSPAAAFVELEQRIAAKTSRADDAADSIAALNERLERKRAEIDAAREANDLLKQEDRERVELAESRASAAARLDEMNDAVEGLHVARAQIESLDAQVVQRREELDTLLAERSAYLSERGDAAASSASLLELDPVAERSLRDKLEEFADEQGKIQRAVDSAKENSASSNAAYEALLELDGDDAVQGERPKRRTSQIVVSVLLPLAFIASGVPLFVHGRIIRSLSFTALGIGLVVLACFLAAGALVMLFRPNKDADALESRRKDAQWVMLQDKKRLDASLAERARLEGEVADFLGLHGMSAANGSIRQARTLLDEAREARIRMTALDQRIASLDMRIESVREALDQARVERRGLAEAAGLEPDAPLRALDAQIKRQSEQRDALSQALESMNMRYGELGERLESARGDTSFDRLKLEYQELQCRLREAKHELVTLLLAKRILEKSIAAWESRSQPEVYAQASRLFSLLTDGRWTRISMTGDGRLVATAADGTIREVRHLSLGTCQQLYLALRVAMLMHAESVGASIPVLADDVLVNFDAVRRRAASRVFAELSQKRQVIVFTCHRETVEALREACGNLTLLEL